MPPQLINNVKRHARYRLQFDSLDERAAVAQAAAECIGQWATVELALGYMFISLLRANQGQGGQLFASFESAKSKRDALQALAVTALDAKGLRLVEYLLKVVKSHQRTRDKIAHWIWGTSDDTPNALVLVNPRAAWELQGKNLEEMWNKMEAGDQGAKYFKPLSRDEVYVYKADWLKEDAVVFQKLSVLIARFTRLVSADPRSRTYGELYIELARDALLAGYEDH